MNALFEIAVANSFIATILALAVWLLTRVMRHPSIVQLLWVLVLAKLVTPPLIVLPWSTPTGNSRAATSQLPTPAVAARFAEHAAPMPDRVDSPPLRHAPAPPVTAPAVSTSTLPPTTEIVEIVDNPPSTHVASREAASLDARAPVDRKTSPSLLPHSPFANIAWTSLAIAVWLAGSVVYALIAAARLTRFQCALRHARPAGAELREIADSVAGILEYRRPFNLRITSARLTPLVWPIGRPTILLAQSLVDELTQEELKTLLAHEFAHLRRKDHWVRWLELTATTLYWWHPVVWLARRAIQNAEERACDAWVVGAFPVSARDYASALLKTVDFVTSPLHHAPMLASGLSSGTDLKERIQHVMNATWKSRLSLPARLALLVIALSILPLSLRAVAEDESPSKTAEIDRAPSGEQLSAERRAAQESPTEAVGSESAADNDPFSRERERSRSDVKPQYAPDPNPLATAREHEIERSLTTPVMPRFVDTPLEEVIAILSATAGIDIILDITTLDEAGINGDELVTINLKNKVSLKSALNLILEQLHLTFVIEDEVLKITTEQRAKQSGQAAPTSTVPDRIQPGETVHVSVLNTFPDAPIDGDFVVEPAGTVALGPAYGRVTIAGLNFEQAGRAVTDLLAAVGLDKPKAQVTMRNPATGLPPETALGRLSELNQRESTIRPRTDSIGILKIFADRAKSEYERAQELADDGVLSPHSSAQKKADYEISLERMRQAQQVLKQRQLELQLAELEYKHAAEVNERLPGSVTKIELEKLNLQVELAKANVAEIAE